MWPNPQEITDLVTLTKDIFCTVIQIVPHFSKFKIRFINLWYIYILQIYNLRYVYKYILQI